LERIEREARCPQFGRDVFNGKDLTRGHFDGREGGNFIRARCANLIFRRKLWQGDPLRARRSQQAVALFGNDRLPSFETRTRNL
jgi:hypothetical protein